jgi:integrase
VRAVRKPSGRRKRAVRPIPPAKIEGMRAQLLGQNRWRDATLLSILAYAGLRPQEALALTWDHIRENTILIERAVSDGRFKGQKTNRPPRTVTLLAPLKQDLAKWRLASGRPDAEALIFPSGAGKPWRDHDWRNWRTRVFAPAAKAAKISGAIPYDLRHSFASLLIQEGRLSIVEIAGQLGNNPTTALDTYAHVMAESEDAERKSPEAEISAARAAAEETPFGSDATQIIPTRQTL